MVTIRKHCERLILLTLINKHLKKKLILNKEILPVLCTFLNYVRSTINIKAVLHEIVNAKVKV